MAEKIISRIQIREKENAANSHFESTGTNINLKK
jgi:hypothetical protein